MVLLLLYKGVYFMNKSLKLNLIDRMLRYVNPKSTVDRIRARLALDRLEESGYITSGSSRRSMRAWNPGVSTADQEILPKAETMRADSRDLYMNTPLATGALRRLKTNAIGFGLRLQCRIDRELLGMSDDAADTWEKQTEREFLTWSNSYECDASRTLAFPQLTGLAFFNTLLSGDTFTLLPKVKRSGQVYDTKIQVVEADYVCNPYLRMNTNRISSGIEIDGLGAPIAYHFRKPYLDGLLSTASYDGLDRWVRIPAYGLRTGRRQVFHLFDKERPGQRRGIPLLAPVVEELKQITRLSKAEVQAAIINSYFTVFVKSQSPVGNVLQNGFMPGEGVFPPGSPGVSTLDSNDGRDDPIYEMGSGNVIEMAEGEDISLADPRRPNANFEPFFLAIVKQIGSSLQIPFEQLMLHFSASYSASRAVLQEAWKFYLERRIWASTYFCQPIYKEWLVEAITKGRIVAPGFFTDPVIQEAWCGTTWTGPGQGQLDPLKETKASILRVKNRLSTYEDEFVAIKGEDWTGAMSRLSREEQLLDDLDLKTDLDETAREVSEDDVVEETVEMGDE
jgi:lambda family phage portal protein